MTAPTIGGPTSPPMAAARVQRAEDGAEPDGAEQPGGDGRGEGDEAAVGDAHHDGEQRRGAA